MTGLNLHTKGECMMKKWILMLLLLALVLGMLCGCSILELSGLQGGLLNQGAENPEPQANFDLDQYASHGQWSDGLAWVETTTESSYDKAAKTVFAYLDTDGNVVSPWFNSEEYEKGNFVNGLLILRRYPNGRIGSKHVIFDQSFNMICEMSFASGRNEDNESEKAIIDANERGEIFGFTEDGLVKITKYGIVEFPLPDHALSYPTVKNLKKIEKQQDYYVVDIRGHVGVNYNIPWYMGVFDEDGNVIFEPSEQIKYDVLSVTVLSEDEFEVLFAGEDKKHYTVKVDASGEFLTEPKVN